MTERTGRRELKKQLSRQAIIAAARQEFSRQGFRETSIADIMTAAGLGIGTFYNYFASKEEILRALLTVLVADVGQALSKKREAGAGSIELLREGCEVTAKFLDENRYVLPLFLAGSDHAAEPSGEGKERTPITPGFKRIFEEILRQGQQAGEIRRDVPAELMTEMFHSLYQAAAFSRFDISFQENVALKTRLLLDGVRSRA